MPRKKEKLVIIDGNALIHRGFHALPQNMRTTEGVLVNGVFGFTSTLLNVMKEVKPDYFIVTFDKSKKVFRHKMFKEYKAKRIAAPQELYDQIPIAHDVVKAMSIPIYEKDNYEADDLIGSLSRRVEDLNKKEGRAVETIIVTGDTDTFQLVDENTRVHKLRRGFSDTEVFSPDRLRAEFGFGPESMVDYRGLKGDSSDNIPGVPGIGEKTALQLIQEFGTLEKLYKKVEATPEGGEFSVGKLTVKGKALQNLKEGKDLAYLSRELSQIVLDLPLKIDFKKSTLIEYNRTKVYDLFQKLQFKSLLRRLPDAEALAGKEERSTLVVKKPSREGKGPTKPAQSAAHGRQSSIFEVQKAEQDWETINKKANYHTVATKAELSALLAKLKKKKEFAIDTETSALGAMNSDLVGISISFKEKEAYYIPVAHAKGKQLDKEFILEQLRPILEDDKIKKFGHNIKYDYVVLLKAGVEIRGINFDTVLAPYLMNPGERGLDISSLSFTELGYEMMPISDLIGKGKNQDSFANVAIDAATFYSGEDADIAYRLKKKFEKPLASDKAVQNIFDTMEVPIIPVLGKVEFNGVLLDVPYLKKLSKQFDIKIKRLSEKIQKTAGEEFNISSPKQLSKILFEKMNISTEGLARTQTGTSTAASELEKLRGKSEIVDDILEYREFTKLKSTYVDALPALVNSETKRIHTTYNQTITATGRLSSVEPNLQNIPVRTDTGMKIREAFVADRGKSFVALDYSQIELRIMAHISGDETFVNAFNKGRDIHATVAAQIHEKKIEDVTTEERREAKIINFAILYGAGARGLSQQTTMNFAEAKEYVDKYFEIHPKIKDTIADIKQQAHDQEYIDTMYGRKRRLPDINASFQMARAAAERAAINMPFQGTNADIMKLAMLEIVKQIPEAQQMMLLQVHDELIFEVADKDISKYAKKFQKIMEDITKLNVPLVVDIEVGKRWSKLEKLA
ncbi:DNA polymerase I [Patescibacteria group bacterium]